MRGGAFVPGDLEEELPELVVPVVVPEVVEVLSPLIPSVNVLDSWPVGVIYESELPTSPAVLFGGGTWEAIQGGQFHRWKRTA